VAWILIHNRCKFGEKIFYNSRDIEFFLRDYFFLARPVFISLLYLSVQVIAYNTLTAILFYTEWNQNLTSVFKFYPQILQYSLSTTRALCHNGKAQQCNNVKALQRNSTVWSFSHGNLLDLGGLSVCITFQLHIQYSVLTVRGHPLLHSRVRPVNLTQKIVNRTDCPLPLSSSCLPVLEEWV